MWTGHNGWFYSVTGSLQVKLNCLWFHKQGRTVDVR